MLKIITEAYKKFRSNAALIWMLQDILLVFISDD
jgi:hypothetical protein